MVLKITTKHSVWDGVPGSDVLREKLAFAKDPKNPELERLAALSYLTGATKVLLTLPSRQLLGKYLKDQIRAVKAQIYERT